MARGAGRGAVCAVDATLPGPGARRDIAVQMGAEGGRRDAVRVRVIVQRVARARGGSDGGHGALLCASRQGCSSSSGGGSGGMSGSEDWRLRLGRSGGGGYLGRQGCPMDAPRGGGIE